MNAYTTEELVQIARDSVKDEYETKAAQQVALENVTRAFEKVRSTVMGQLLNTPHEERDEEWNKLYWGFPSYPHQWNAKAVKLFHKWSWASQTASELKALRDEIKGKAIAPKVSKPAPAPVPEEGRMTCQVCGRPIMANTGNIAHHGYERPGYGWQTASCEGATHEPFETSRVVLGQYIERLNRRHDELVERQRQINDHEVTETTLATPDYDLSSVSFSRHRPSIYLELSVETFEAKAAEHPRTFRTLSLRSFEDVLKRELKDIERQLSGLSAEIAQQEVRYGGWRQTHRWDGYNFVEV